MMKRLPFLLILLLLSILAQPSSGAEPSLASIRQELQQHGVAYTSEADSVTFGIRGVEHAFAVSFFKKLSAYYLLSGEITGVTVLHIRGINPEDPADGWKAAADAGARMLVDFTEGGVPPERIEVILKADPQMAPTSAVIVTLHEDPGYFSRVGSNLVEGLTDVLASPAELPKKVVEKGREEGVAGGAMGVLNGFGAAIRRAGTGAIRLLTFWAG